MSQFLKSVTVTHSQEIYNKLTSIFLVSFIYILNIYISLAILQPYVQRIEVNLFVSACVSLYSIMITITKNMNIRLAQLLRYSSSYKNSLINATPSKYADQRDVLKENIWRTPDLTYKKSEQTHLSNGEYLIHKIPVVYSDSAIVRCIVTNGRFREEPIQELATPRSTSSSTPAMPDNLFHANGAVQGSH